MALLDLRLADDESFVLHFGGRTRDVDAQTFGSALVAVAEAIEAVNTEINPGYSIEVFIEAVGPGSFRAKLKTSKRELKNLFSARTARSIVVALLASFLWDAIHKDAPPVIIVDEDYVIVEYNGGGVVIPKGAYDQRDRIDRSPIVRRKVVRVMDALESDPRVESFGIGANLNDEPIIEIPRALFPTVRKNSDPNPEEEKRHRDVQARLLVHKAVFERSSRKWEFIYDGFRISAPILDQNFFDRLEAHDISLGQGDALEAQLRVHQRRDPGTAAWLNTSYEVLAVGEVLRRHRRD